MLAQRISSINSLSALCEKTGASIQEYQQLLEQIKELVQIFEGIGWLWRELFPKGYFKPCVFMLEFMV